MPSFLSSIADKAQSAINASPLAGHIPSNLSGRSSAPDLSGQPQAATQSGYRSHAFDAIQHQLRTIGQQYSTTSPLQKIITTEKGVAIDFDSVSRDAKTQSKELFTWGQSEAKDLEDVTDRLAYLNFIQGALASSLAEKLDAARAPLKSLRDLENSLAPRRNIRAGLKLQISKLELDQQRGTELRIAELKQQLKKSEHDDEAAEKQAEILKRKAIRESEQAKWDALREYAEKLVLVSKAANPVISALPSLPPTPAQPYAGGQDTAAARAALQRALDNYKTGYINLSLQLPTDLSRSDTASFGESHASELSSIDSDHVSVAPGIPLTPPTVGAPLPPVVEVQDAAAPREPTQPKAIDPLTLNQTPTVLPSSTMAATSPEPATSEGSNEPPIPTIADTGVPVSAGAEGPGPASGSLLDLRAQRLSSQSSSTPVAAAATTAPESAEDEKKRLEREEKERVLAAQSPPGVQSSGTDVRSSSTATAPPTTSTTTATYESAEDEKRRLQREERERVLRQDPPQDDQGGDQDGPKDEAIDEDLPPYRPI